MREILFRGKTYDGEWEEGCLILSLNGKRFYIGNMYLVEEIDPETVGQYTGLTANGKKIFEGDIVKGLFLHGDSVLSVVAFKDGAFGLEWNKGTVKAFSAFTSICNVRYEKIGNIHDNPELLKEGADNG